MMHCRYIVLLFSLEEWNSLQDFPRQFPKLLHSTQSIWLDNIWRSCDYSIWHTSIRLSLFFLPLLSEITGMCSYILISLIPVFKINLYTKWCCAEWKTNLIASTNVLDMPYLSMHGLSNMYAFLFWFLSLYCHQHPPGGCFSCCDIEKENKTAKI